jgi:hypothetical protein
VFLPGILSYWRRHLFVRFGEYKDGFPVHYASIWLVLENSRNDTESCLTNLKASFEIRIVNEQGRVEQEQSKTLSDLIDSYA